MQGFGTDYGINSGIHYGAIAATAVGLLAFGLVFNWLVNRWNRAGYDDGYTWLLVVIGTAVTVIAAGFTIGWTAVVLLGFYFAASGLPMAVGDIWRHVKARRAEHDEAA